MLAVSLICFALPASAAWQWTNDYKYYIFDNNYAAPPGTVMSSWISSETSWGGSYDFNGGSGGIGAGQLNRGLWPWTTVSTQNSQLPFRIDDPDRSAYSFWQFGLTPVNSPGWNMYWEIFAHSSSTINPETISLDLMIHPTYDNTDDFGDYYGDFYDVYGQQWYVYMSPFGGTDIPLVHFAKAEKSTELTVYFDGFWDYCVTQGWGQSSDYIGSFGTGMEARSGSGSFETTYYIHNIY
ncbi:thymidylate synthase family protein [Paenibacillus swuensis]|uniref:hypothetical protein n=1 Tax=Paenibacillus swuensis TaxID=1178515 RepID=UPI0018D4B20F|nr:hypothetical protein [Paenibacillus swuensis]